MFKLILNLFAFTVFFIGLQTQDAFAAKECLSDVIDKQVEERYQNLEKTSVGQHALQKIDKKIKDGIIGAEHKETVLKANLEMAVRKQSGCSIPDELKSRLTKFYKVGEDRGERDHCSAHKFLQEAKKKYRKMKKEKGYADFEKMMFAEINLAIGSASGQEKFAKQWESQSFKDKVIMTVVRVQLREEGGCKNPGLPMSDLIRDMM